MIGLLAEYPDLPILKGAYEFADPTEFLRAVVGGYRASTIRKRMSEGSKYLAWLEIVYQIRWPSRCGGLPGGAQVGRGITHSATIFRRHLVLLREGRGVPAGVHDFGRPGRPIHDHALKRPARYKYFVASRLGPGSVRRHFSCQS